MRCPVLPTVAAITIATTTTATAAIVTTTTTIAVIIPAGGTRGSLGLETITTIDGTIFTRHKWNSGSMTTRSADGFILFAARSMRTRRLRTAAGCSAAWAPTGRVG